MREPVIIMPHGGREAASLAEVMSRRQFTGSWEYLLEGAIFTAPPTMTWAGAALVNRQLRLVGVGSLLVRDTVEPGTPEPGSMFVPTDLLKPILAELKANGRTAGPQRPWLGLNTEEVQGRLLVSRVSPEGPAARAGVRQGDVVVGVAGEPVKTHVELYRKVWSLGAAGVEVPLRLSHGADVRDVRVKSIDRFSTSRASGACERSRQHEGRTGADRPRRSATPRSCARRGWRAGGCWPARSRAALAGVPWRVGARSRIATPRRTEGPFYPDQLPADDDNDLVAVKGQSGIARGEILLLAGTVMDLAGKPLAGARSIWRCDEAAAITTRAIPRARRQIEIPGLGAVRHRCRRHVSLPHHQAGALSAARRASTSRCRAPRSRGS